MCIRDRFQDVFINAVEQGVSKMDFKSVTDDMSGVMYKFPFRLPPYYALIIRSFKLLFSLILFNFIDCGR